MASLSAADLNPLVLNNNNNCNNNNNVNDNNNNDNSVNKATTLPLSVADLRLRRSAGPVRAATVVERRNLPDEDFGGDIKNYIKIGFGL